MSRNTGPSQAVRDAVRLRDGFVCRRCGDALGVQIHHRAPRGAGGTRCSWINNKANLVLLCLTCHQHVESRRTEALADGWLIRRTSGDLPEEVPLIDILGRHLLLDDEGGITYLTKGAT